MHAFRVDDMTCGHCASTLTKAIRGVDKKATVTVDLSQHLVMVEPTEADAQELRDAIAEAGYTPVPVQAPTGVAMPAQSSCCGCHSGRGPGQA